MKYTLHIEDKFSFYHMEFLSNDKPNTFYSSDRDSLIVHDSDGKEYNFFGYKWYYKEE